MAYVRERKTYRLIFEGDLAGLEVVARSGGVRDYVTIAALAGLSFPLKSDDVDKAVGAYEAFGRALVSWNLEEPEGVPVPATLDGLLSQDPELVERVISAWMDAVGTGMADTAAAAAQTELFEHSLPVEVLD